MINSAIVVGVVVAVPRHRLQISALALEPAIVHRPLASRRVDIQLAPQVADKPGNGVGIAQLYGQPHP